MTGRRFYFLVLPLLAVSILIYVQLSYDAYLRAPDAYYYALQADYWATTGQVKIPDSSIIHRLIGTLQKSGLATENAIRIWICLSLLLLGVLTLLLAKKAGIVVMALSVAWLLISPSLLFVAIEFPKLFSFLFTIPIFLYLVRLPPPNNLYAFIPLILSVFLHKAAIPIAGMIGVIILLENYRKVLLDTRSLVVLALAVGGLVIFYFTLGDRFNILDLARLGGWKNLSPGLVTLLGRDALPIAIKIELVITMLFFITSLVLFVNKHTLRSWPPAYCFALLLPGLFPFSANEVFGIGERYAILMPYFLVLSTVLLLSYCEVTAKIRQGLVFIPVLVITVFVPFRLTISHPDYLDPDNKTYDEVTSLIADVDIPMLIAHRGFNFYYKFRTHKEAFHYEPEKHWDKTRIWRLIYRITPDELAYYLDSSCGWDSGLIKSVGRNEYFLIREDCWFKFRSTITAELDQDLYTRVWLSWQNPSKPRPAFLYRKHKKYSQDENDEFSTFEK